MVTSSLFSELFVDASVFASPTKRFEVNNNKLETKSLSIVRRSSISDHTAEPYLLRELVTFVLAMLFPTSDLFLDPGRDGFPTKASDLRSFCVAFQERFLRMKSQTLGTPASVPLYLSQSVCTCLKHTSHRTKSLPEVAVMQTSPPSRSCRVGEPPFVVEEVERNSGSLELVSRVPRQTVHLCLPRLHALALTKQ